MRDGERKERVEVRVRVEERDSGSDWRRRGRKGRGGYIMLTIDNDLIYKFSNNSISWCKSNRGLNTDWASDFVQSLLV